jgi:hypothetical protein
MKPNKLLAALGFTFFQPTNSVLANVLGVDADHDWIVGTGDELRDGVALGVWQGNAPFSGIGKAAFMQVLDGGEYVMAIAHK